MREHGWGPRPRAGRLREANARGRLGHAPAEVWHGEAGEITLTLTMTLTWHAPAEAWHGEAGGMQMRA